jgi:hypothetical protein
MGFGGVRDGRSRGRDESRNSGEVELGSGNGLARREARLGWEASVGGGEVCWEFNLGGRRPEG